MQLVFSDPQTATCLDNETNPVPEMNPAITFSDQSTPGIIFLFYLCGHCDYIDVVMPNKNAFKK